MVYDKEVDRADAAKILTYIGEGTQVYRQGPEVSRRQET